MTWKVHKGDVQPAPLPPVEAHEPVALAGFYDAPPLTLTQRACRIAFALWCVDRDLTSPLADRLNALAERMYASGKGMPYTPDRTPSPDSPVRQRRAARTS